MWGIRNNPFVDKREPQHDNGLHYHGLIELGADDLGFSPTCHQDATLLLEIKHRKGDLPTDVVEGNTRRNSYTLHSNGKFNKNDIKIKTLGSGKEKNRDGVYGACEGKEKDGGIVVGLIELPIGYDFVESTQLKIKLARELKINGVRSPRYRNARPV